MAQQGHPALPNPSEPATYLFKDTMDTDSITTVSGDESSPTQSGRESITDGSSITAHGTQLSDSSEWLLRVTSLFQKAAGGSGCPLPFLPTREDRKCAEATYVKELHAFLTRWDLEAPKEMSVSDAFHHISHDITVMMALPGADGGQAPAGQAPAGPAAAPQAAAPQAAGGQAAGGQAAGGQAADGQAADGQAADGQAADGQAVDGQPADDDDSESDSDYSFGHSSEEIGPATAPEPHISKSDLEFLGYSKSGLKQLKRVGLEQLYIKRGLNKPAAQPQNKRKKPDSVDRMVDDLHKRQKKMWDDKTKWIKGQCEDGGIATDKNYAVMRRRLDNYGKVRLVNNERLLISLLNARGLAIADDNCERLLALLVYEWNAGRIRCGWDSHFVFEERAPVGPGGERKARSRSITPSASSIREPTEYIFYTRSDAFKSAHDNKWGVYSNFETLGNSLFRLVNVCGDGNCLLRAFARGYYGHEQKHKQVRNDIFEYWDRVDIGFDDPNNILNVARAEFYRRIEYCISCKQLDNPIADLQTQISVSGTWCSDDILQILADVYGVTIIIWLENRSPNSPDHFNAVIVRGSAVEAHTQRQIHILHVGNDRNGHYQSFIPITLTAEGPWRYTDHVATLQGPFSAIPQAGKFFPLYDCTDEAGTCNQLYPDLQWTREANDTVRGPRYPGAGKRK